MQVADLESSAVADAKTLVGVRNKGDEIQRRLQKEKAEHLDTTALLEEERARYERCRARLETSQEHLADLNERFNELRAEVEVRLGCLPADDASVDPCERVQPDRKTETELVRRFLYHARSSHVDNKIVSRYKIRTKLSRLQRKTRKAKPGRPAMRLPRQSWRYRDSEAC